MIKWYSECNRCGTITIHFNNGTHKEVSKKYIKDNGIDLTKSVRLPNVYNCENCYPMEKICEYIMKAK